LRNPPQHGARTGLTGRRVGRGACLPEAHAPARQDPVHEVALSGRAVGQGSGASSESLLEMLVLGVQSWVGTHDVPEG
jgi:hypothetical protein